MPMPSARHQSIHLFRVYLAKTKTQAAQTLAIKVVTSANPMLFTNEVATLTDLKHKNIIKIIDHNEAGTLLVNEKACTIKYIALELCEKGSLQDFIFTTKALSEICARTIFRQIVSGLSYMHSKGIYHRNLSLNNILLDAHYNVKISDFSFEELENKLFNKSIRSPEILDNSSSVNFSACDVFSLGVLLFNMTLNKSPFLSATSDNLTYKFIIDNKVEEFWKTYDSSGKLSKDLKLLIAGMIMSKPSQRLTLNEVEHYEWFNKDVLNEVQLLNEFQTEHSIYSNLKQQLPYLSVYKKQKKQTEIFREVDKCMYNQQTKPNGVSRILKNCDNELKYSTLIPFVLSCDPTKITVPSSFMSNESITYVFSCLEEAFTTEIGTMGDIEISDSHFEIICNYKCGFQEDNSVELKLRLYLYESKVYAKFTKIEGSDLAWHEILDKLFHSDIVLSLI